MKILPIIITILCACEIIQCANIVAMIPTPFYSHQATFRPLWRELAKRGHKITLLTTNLMEKNENITQIDLSETYKLFEKYEMSKMLRGGYNGFELVNKLFALSDDLFETQLRHPDLVKLLKDETKFDLMFVEFLFPVFPNLAFKFNCPFIGITTMDAPSVTHGSMGNAEHPGIYPYADFGYGNELSFKERLISTSFNLFFHLLGNTLFPYLGNAHVKKYLGEGQPDIRDVQANASLLFVNANPIFFPARPIAPTTINLGGGLNLKKPQKLPKDLQEYLDKSKDGCIYFSFGSTVKSNYLSEDTIETFRKAFEELAPLRVLWKFDNTTIPNIPKNVEIRKWLPQQDILRHPNVKVFITQGGLHSMEEAIDSAVPTLGMPFYGDQLNNVRKMVIQKFGVELNVKTFDKESLKNSILELLRNPIYKKNIDRLSVIFKDQPMNGLQKAVWWTEYVLRHGGTQHLRSPSADIPYYQYFFLDIMAVVIPVLILITVIFCYWIKFIRYIFRKLFRRTNKVKTN